MPTVEDDQSEDDQSEDDQSEDDQSEDDQSEDDQSDPPTLEDDQTDPRATADEAPPAPRGRSTGFLVAVTLAAVFFVTTVVFAVIAVAEKGENDDLTGDRDAVTEAAGQFMDALLRFDYTDPEANREAVLALSAVQFRSQFEDAFPQNVALFEEFQMVTTPTIEDVYVSDIADDQATAIVEYDRIIETAERTNTEDGMYAQLEMARIDGRWLVTTVLNLNFALGGIDGGGAADTTTTTVVPPP